MGLKRHSFELRNSKFHDWALVRVSCPCIFEYAYIVLICILRRVGKDSF